jgi:hypothetical protein
VKDSAHFLTTLLSGRSYNFPPQAATNGWHIAGSVLVTVTVGRKAGDGLPLRSCLARVIHPSPSMIPACQASSVQWSFMALV